MIAALHSRSGASIVMTLLLALLLNGCIQSTEVDIDDLLSNPERYHGRQVCTEGMYASGFEINGLGASTYQERVYVYLTEPVIWIESADVKSSTDCFKSATLPPVEFCKATVCGVFEYGGSYGHVGAYEYQLRGND